jgi:hypothetical protein
MRQGSEKSHRRAAKKKPASRARERSRASRDEGGASSSEAPRKKPNKRGAEAATSRAARAFRRKAGEPKGKRIVAA